MIGYEEALRQVLEGVAPVPSKTFSITECLGACLAEKVVAQVDLPGFDTASMDGYAVRSADLGGVEAPGGSGRGVVLPCSFTVAAGQAADRAVAPGQCARILTGAPMPAGADCVVMQEDTEREPDGRIRFLEGARPWENVRFRGEDFRAGTPVLSAGQRLGPPQLALAVAAGHSVLTVHRPVRVAVLVSGDELRPPGSPWALARSTTAIRCCSARCSGPPARRWCGSPTCRTGWTTRSPGSGRRRPWPTWW